jgi:hypothetical protein
VRLREFCCPLSATSNNPECPCLLTITCCCCCPTLPSFGPDGEDDLFHYCCPGVRPIFFFFPYSKHFACYYTGDRCPPGATPHLVVAAMMTIWWWRAALLSRRLVLIRVALLLAPSKRSWS